MPSRGPWSTHLGKCLHVCLIVHRTFSWEGCGCRQREGPEHLCACSPLSVWLDSLHLSPTWRAVAWVSVGPVRWGGGCVLSQSGGRASGAGFVWSSVSGAWILWLGVSAVGTCGWGICVAGTPESFLSAHCVLELAVSRAPAQYTAGPSTSAHRCAFLPRTPDDGVGIPVYFAGQGLPTPSLVPIVTIKVCQKQPLGRLGVISGRVWWARHRDSQVK